MAFLSSLSIGFGTCLDRLRSFVSKPADGRKKVEITRSVAPTPVVTRHPIRLPPRASIGSSAPSAPSARAGSLASRPSNLFTRLSTKLSPSSRPSVRSPDAPARRIAATRMRSRLSFPTDGKPDLVVHQPPCDPRPWKTWKKISERYTTPVRPILVRNPTQYDEALFETIATSETTSGALKADPAELDDFLSEPRGPRGDVARPMNHQQRIAVFPPHRYYIVLSWLERHPEARKARMATVRQRRVEARQADRKRLAVLRQRRTGTLVKRRSSAAKRRSKAGKRRGTGGFVKFDHETTRQARSIKSSKRILARARKHKYKFDNVRPHETWLLPDHIADPDSDFDADSDDSGFQTKRCSTPANAWLPSADSDDQPGYSWFSSGPRYQVDHEDEEPEPEPLSPSTASSSDVASSFSPESTAPTSPEPGACDFPDLTPPTSPEPSPRLLPGSWASELLSDDDDE